MEKIYICARVYRDFQKFHNALLIKTFQPFLSHNFDLHTLFIIVKQERNPFGSILELLLSNTKPKLGIDPAWKNFRSERNI